MVSGTGASPLEAEDDPDVHAVSVQAVNNMYIIRLIGWYRKKVPFIDPTYFCQKPLRVQRYNNFLNCARKRYLFFDPPYFFRETGTKKAQPFDCALARWANIRSDGFIISRKDTKNRSDGVYFALKMPNRLKKVRFFAFFRLNWADFWRFFATFEPIYKKAMLIFYEQNNLHAFKKIFIDQYEFAVKEYF